MLVCLEGLYRDVAPKVVAGTDVRTVITTSELELPDPQRPAAVRRVERQHARGHLDMAELVETLPRADAARRSTLEPGRHRVPDLHLRHHRAAQGRDEHPRATWSFNAQIYRDWVGLAGDDVVLGVAPLFHITGLIAHIAIALLARRAAGADLPVRPDGRARRDRASTGRRSPSARSRCSSR